MAFTFIFSSIYLLIYLPSIQTESDYINCRTESGTFNSLEQYKLDTCANCYKYMPELNFKNKFLYFEKGYLYDAVNKQLHLSNSTSVISSTFAHIQMSVKWLQCCEAAELCCIEQLNKTTPSQSDGRCAPTWDGWSCWPNGAAPNQLATNSICPSHIYWLSFNAPPCRGHVLKSCLANGSWYQQNGREWTNYGNCARDDIYIKRNWFKITTHLISVGCIVPALFIFNYYRQLSRVSRIRVHKHLLSNLLIYSILMSLLTLEMLLQNSQTNSVTSVTSADHKEAKSKFLFIYQFFNSKTIRTILCKTLSLTSQYFRSTSYLWMFNEAFYLHKLIKQAFTTPSLTPLLIIAYGIPTLTTLVYIFCRNFQLDFALTTNLLTNHSSSTLNSINSTNLTASNHISKYYDPLDLVPKFSALSFGNQSFADFDPNVNTNSFNFSNSSNDESKSYMEDEEVIDQLTNLYGTSYEDQCWSLPSPIAWHEWIINIPNLCILIINCIFLFSMLREIYLKAESSSGQQKVQRKRTVHTSSPTYNRPIRAYFLFTGWKQSKANVIPKSASSPSISAAASSNRTLQKPSMFSTAASDNQIRINPDEKQIVIEENELVGHKIEDKIDANNNNNFEDGRQEEETDLTSINGKFNNSKESIKRRPSTRSFSKTKIAVKRQLSRLLSDKDSGADLASRSSANLEQHTSGHRTSILVSLRAASILLPLYGLHYLVFVYRLDTTAGIDALQGCLVAILFCFATNEVQQVLKRSFLNVHT